MTRRHQHHARVVTRFVKMPEVLEDGRVRCAGCGKVVKLTPNKHLRAHKSPSGEPCAHRASYGHVQLSSLPDVVVPPQREDRDRSTWKPSKEPEPSRLDAGSECIDCGKWLPGERYVCGRCYLRREEDRKTTRKDRPNGA